MAEWVNWNFLLTYFYLNNFSVQQIFTQGLRTLANALSVCSASLIGPNTKKKSKKSMPIRLKYIGGIIIHIVICCYFIYIRNSISRASTAQSTYTLIQTQSVVILQYPDILNSWNNLWTWFILLSYVALLNFLLWNFTIINLDILCSEVG